MERDNVGEQHELGTLSVDPYLSGPIRQLQRHDTHFMNSRTWITNKSR